MIAGLVSRHTGHPEREECRKEDSREDSQWCRLVRVSVNIWHRGLREILDMQVKT